MGVGRLLDPLWKTQHLDLLGSIFLSHFAPHWSVLALIL